MSKLLTNKEALIALANGEEVQYISLNDPSTPPRWTTIKAMRDYNLDSFLNPNTDFQFRLKPRTITLNGIEVPATFEPKEGERYYYLWDCQEGYSSTSYKDSDPVIIGAWRTEDEIKQVVAALHSILNKQTDTL